MPGQLMKGKELYLARAESRTRYIIVYWTKPKGHKVQWHTDNQNIVRVIDRGSTKTDLQSLVEDIVYLCAENHVVVVPVWRPREQNQ